ncbi:MAG: hypothetical protein KDA85_15425, partial [Planctomycetaceae bacterium]|nr:hypothetical protein [Planctomycetaceae bacterium]
MSEPESQSPPSAPPAPDSIEGLFLMALQQPATERDKFLARHCGNDENRRQRLEALLRAYEGADS